MRLSRSGRIFDRREKRRMRGKEGDLTKQVSITAPLISHLRPAGLLTASPPKGEANAPRSITRERTTKSLLPSGGARGVRKSQTAWLFQPSADAAVPQRQAFRPKGEKTDEGAFVNIHHLIRRSAPPSPHRGRNTGAAHCFIGCGQPKAFPRGEAAMRGRWQFDQREN